jgi:hypothetical protein
VLPVSTIAFHPGAPGLPASLEARPRAALASGLIFRVPLLKHLWSWLGLQSVDRRNMRCGARARSAAARGGGWERPGGAQRWAGAKGPFALRRSLALWR